MESVKVWDPLVRIFHWSVVLLFGANALVIDEESHLHLWVGYTVLALVALRLLWGVLGTRHARFSDFPPSLSGARAQIGEMRRGSGGIHLGHTPLGALMIYNLLLTLVAIGLSGWLMTTDAFWGVEWPEELHAAAVSWAELSVVVHVVAVIAESRRSGVNLVRAMIVGSKEIPSR